MPRIQRTRITWRDSLRRGTRIVVVIGRALARYIVNVLALVSPTSDGIVMRCLIRGVLRAWEYRQLHQQWPPYVRIVCPMTREPVLSCRMGPEFRISVGTRLRMSMTPDGGVVLQKSARFGRRPLPIALHVAQLQAATRAESLPQRCLVLLPGEDLPAPS